MKWPYTLSIVPAALAVGFLAWAASPPAAMPLSPATAPSAVGSPGGRYDPAALLAYRAADGSAVPTKSAADWPKRREQILAAMQRVTGDFPDRANPPPLDVKVLAEQPGDGFVRQTIEYTSEVNARTGKPERVPAYLFVPTNLKPGERRPAVLALHPTSKLGKAEITGAGKPNRQYGLELAKRGYVVICPDYPSFGDYAKDFAASAHSSGTMQGIVNHVAAVDLLVARPDVDAGRIAAIGHSLGGHNALFAAAFDPRIRAVVTSCGWNAFEDYYGGNLAGWASDRYMPRIRTEYALSPARMPFDFHEVLAAIAPRAVLSVSPTHDANFAVEGVRKGINAARPVYTLLGAPDALQVEHPDCAHDFPDAMRERAYAFLDAELKRPAAAAPAAPVVRTSQPAPRAKDLSAELPRIPARSPEEARKLIHTLPGFQVQLVAAEPLVLSPVAVDFDADGRAYVCEMIDYPFATPEPLGKVVVLEDTDGDGAFDKRTVLADKIPWPTAVLCFDGGCFVGSAPDILYLKDTTGDGAADVRKTVFTGFGKQNVQGLLNSFRWGIDNRVHGATGTNGGSVHRADLPAGDPKAKPVNLSGRDFSFDPRELDLRPESGGAQHGMCFDDFGRKFVCSNSDHIQQVVYDDRYAAKSSVVPLPPARVSIAADGPQAKVFRVSPVEPWRIVRTRMRVSGEAKGLVEGGGQPAGYFTGATGVTIYRGDAFPPECRGQAFIGDVGSNLVHRKVLKPVPGSVLLRAERVDEGKEFLASEDVWFRPAQFANAPDGTLWVLDVCREVIEHPASIPDSIKQHLDLTAGRDRGRIWRVVPDGYKQRPAPKLSKATTAELVKLLEHGNAWHRETASRLLYERGDKAEMTKLLVDDLEPMRLSAVGLAHVISARRLLGGTDASLVHLVFHLGDFMPDEVVPHLIRTVGAEAVLKHFDYRRPERVNAESALLMNLGLPADNAPADHKARAGVVASTLTGPAGDDRYVRSAALGAAADLPVEVLDAVLATNMSDAAPKVNAARDLARLATRRGQARDLERVAAAPDRLSTAQADALAAGVLEGSRDLSEPARTAILSGPLGTAVKRALASARTMATDPVAEPASRVAAVALLKSDRFADVREPLAGLLGGREPQEVQLAAVAAFDAFAEPEVAAVLTAALPKLTPAVRPAAVQALVARPARAAAFLSAVDAGKLPATLLDPATLARLRQSKDAEVRRLADAVAAKAKVSPRAEAVAAYRKALDLSGDIPRGHTLFAQRCAACHKLDGEGNEVGPNLAAMRSRGAEAVLVNLIDPNREVNGQYVEYQLETKDGRTASGLLSAESAAAVTLLKPGGAAETIARADIATLRSTGQSIMPEGLERDLDAQAVADLIAFVMKER